MATTLSGGSGFRGASTLASLDCRCILPLVALLIFILGLSGYIPARAATPPTEEKYEKPYALIFGTVWGPDNRPVYGVKVKIRRADQKKPKWEQYSNHTGEFAQRVPAGRADYVVWADLKGFKSPEYKSLHAGTEVTVHIQNDERADIGVHLTK
jgi:hypothetical protein